ncbi:MAG: hypothetical protein ACTSPA_01670 [Promethearchaeota archaeon]
MSLEEEKKQKIIRFLKGFVISYISIAFFIFLLFVGDEFGFFGYLSTLIPLGILISVFFVSLKKENYYIVMGLITAFFGPAFNIIKKNEDPFVEPYMEQPTKKKTHFIYGFILSIGLVILYSPLTYYGTDIMMTTFFFPIPVLIGAILLNIFIGLLKFFSQEKLQYISKGMIPSFIIGNLVIIIWVLNQYI